MARELPVWLFGCAAVVGGLQAQELPIIAGTPASRCQFDTAAFRDTSDYALFLTPPVSVPGAWKRHSSYAPYIAAIASTFEQPARLSLTYWPGTHTDTDEPNAVPRCVGKAGGCTSGILEGEVQFRLRDGRVQTLQWLIPPDSPEAAAALEQAIRRADSLRLFPPGARLKGLPRGTVRIGIRMARELASAGGAAVSKIRLPFIRATTPVAILHQDPPPYPTAPVSAEVIVSLRYVVDVDGRVETGSVRVVPEESQAYPVFIRAAKHAVALSRFRPARAGPCPVRLMVAQRVVFRSR